MYNDSRLLMQIIRMNLETALIAPSFAPTAMKIIAQPLDAHATSLLHAAAGLQHYVVIINSLYPLKPYAAAHGAVAVACVLAQIDDDPATPRLDARDANGATPLIRSDNAKPPNLFEAEAFSGQRWLGRWPWFSGFWAYHVLSMLLMRRDRRLS